MDRLQAMQVFVRVAESGGFASAGRALNMSPSAATRSVAAIEAAIGTRLLARTTRSVRLTEAGSRYLEDCRRILSEIEEAEAVAAGAYATPTGLLTVGASVQFGRIYVLPIVTDYLTRHVGTSARTLFVDRLVNMAEEGIDVAVRIANLPDSSLRAVRVGSVRRVVCAAPAYLEARGEPHNPADLRLHEVIGQTGSSAPAAWRFGSVRPITVGVHPRLTCNTVDSALAAALDGQGLVRLLSYQVAAAVAEGRLRIVLAEHEEEPMPIHVVTSGDRGMSAKVRAFVDLAVDRLRANRMMGALEAVPSGLRR